MVQPDKNIDAHHQHTDPEIVDLFCTHETHGETLSAVTDKRNGPTAADVADTASQRA